MPNLETLSANKLNELEAKRYAKCSANATALVAAGFGLMKHWDVMAAAKLPGANPLFVECVKLNESWQEVRREIERRLRWHGSANPIRKPKAA